MKRSAGEAHPDDERVPTPTPTPTPTVAESGTGPNRPPEHKADPHSERLQNEATKHGPSAAQASITDMIDEVQQLEGIRGVFRIEDLIGSGGFSTVYKAHHLLDEDAPPLALKVIVPTTSPRRIDQEIKCLHILRNNDHVGRIQCVLRAGSGESTRWILGLTYFEHTPITSELVQKMPWTDMRAYMFSLLTVISEIHACNMIHRDIKPTNFLFRDADNFRLIDFGLVQTVDNTTTFATPALAIQKEKARRKKIHRRRSEPLPARDDQYLAHDAADAPNVNRAGTRGYRPPEVLLRFQLHSTAIDVWAAGTIFLSLLSGRLPFFPAADDADALAEQMATFGINDYRALCRQLGKQLVAGRLPSTVPSTEHSPATLKRLCLALRKHHHLDTLPDSAFDLLYQLLTIDPCKRITAAKALKHPFFTEKKATEPSTNS